MAAEMAPSAEAMLGTARMAAAPAAICPKAARRSVALKTVLVRYWDNAKYGEVRSKEK
jgi:hypothetical protein